MHRHLKNEQGMSLVEATIILLILATLTAVIAPSMGDFLEDARQMKAKEDVEALGISIKRLLRDTGFLGLKFNDGTAGFTKANRLDLLRSDGTNPGATGTTFNSTDNIADTNFQWTGGTNRDTFENQFVRNAPGGTPGTAYAVPTEANRGRGWRGGYLNSPIGADPWGYRYFANTVFLTVATDATGVDEGKLYWTKDVIVISAGKDNTIQAAIGGTAGGGSSAATTSDDVIYVLQGNSF